jgi:predicted amidophosphoribosyltransferase
VGPAGGRCASCVLDPWELDAVLAAVAYTALARRFLLRAKLDGRRELLAPLGRQLGCVLVQSGFARDSDAVVPVAAHPWTLLRRGFNPAREIARVVAAALGLPLWPGVLSRRLGHVRASKRLGRRQRRRVSAAAFRARRGVAGRRILLVDDVLTTGATAEGCARALRQAGAAQVRLAVWARTLPREAELPGEGV